MKRQIKNYTFTPGAAGVGTITFTDITTIRLDSILVIFNVTRQAIIFNLADIALGGTVATNVLTLEGDTATHNSGDSLYITYDDEDLDYNNGAGTAHRLASGLIVPGGTGPVAITGDATNGLDVDVTRVGGTVTVAGLTAADSAIAANPLTVGARASTTLPTAVSDGDVVNLAADKHGRLITNGSPRELRARQHTAFTTTTEADITAAAGASTYADLYMLFVTNTSSTGISVTIKDAHTAQSGLTHFTFYVPALSTVGFSLPQDSAVPQSIANDGWTLTCSAGVTTIYCMAAWVKST